MDLLARLHTLCEHSPPGTVIQLPVDWLRAELEKMGEAGQRGAVFAAMPTADLTVEEAANVVGRAPGTIRDWIRQGRLRAYLFNDREYRITRVALQEYLDAQRNRTDTPPPGWKAPQLQSEAYEYEGKHTGLGSWRNLRPETRRALPNGVYFVQSVSTGLIKIGVSANVRRRVRDLQNGSGDEIRILKVIEGAEREREKRLHERFKEFWSHGEWFHPAPEILQYIERTRN